MRQSWLVCVVCGELFPADHLTEFEGDCFCHNCLERETVICRCCGERVWRDDALGDRSTPLCENCEEYSTATAPTAGGSRSWMPCGIRMTMPPATAKNCTSIAS